MILGVDTGFSNLGFSVFDRNLEIVDIGLIETSWSEKKMTRVSDDENFRVSQMSRQFADVLEKYKVKGVLGEAPAGSKSAKAMAQIKMGYALVCTVLAIKGIPVEWETPQSVKKAICGKKNASKAEIMAGVCQKYGWEITTKEREVKGKKKPYLVYCPLGYEWPAERFEHVADSIAVMEALRYSNIVRSFTKNSE